MTGSQQEKDRYRVYTYLKTASGVSSDDLSGYADKFSASRSADSESGSLSYDQNLASQGDAFGLLRMGQRYRDGDGVLQNDATAQELLARAAGQGDPAAASQLGSMNPAVPGNQINVTASSVYSPQQAVQHLIDGSGMSGGIHDNAEAAQTMWQSRLQPTLRRPELGLPVSPAWVRFDFAQPTKFDSVLVWNCNQAKLTNRGFRRTCIYGSADGTTWVPLTSPRGIELPRASGTPAATPTAIANVAAGQPLKAVIIAAAATDGNYGGDCYGLSAVRFAVHPLLHVVPAKEVAVTASSVFGSDQVVQHLVDGSGMVGALHDNEEAARTMWHTSERPTSQPPASGLPASPAWVKFDFAQPQQINSLLIWNHNQIELTDRGFRKVHIYGSTDGATWHPLTSSQTIELPRASGTPMSEPTSVPLVPSETMLKSVIIAADEVDGNYGGNAFGLSAVRFVLRHK